MTCRELVRNSTSSDKVNFNNYHWLHPDGQQLISSWLIRAWEMRDCTPEESFEPFIFTWISFNGWSACVTGLDIDRAWLEALMQSPRICNAFSLQITNQESPISVYARQFNSFWPIFKAQAIRRSRVDRFIEGPRQEVINHYLNAGIRSFEPQCWTRHQEEGTPIPLDWPHTLAALYRVRCNLFHGEKAAHSEMDAMIVNSAFRVLINFLFPILNNSDGIS